MMASPMLRRVFQAINRPFMNGPMADRLLQKAVVVFLYHEISEAPSSFNHMFDLNVPPAMFRRQLDLIGERFAFIAPQQLLAGDYRTPAALITFDDGNLSYVRHAVPILREKGIPSVCFINIGPARGEPCWSGLAAFLRYRNEGVNGRRLQPDHQRLQMTDAEIAACLSSGEAEVLCAQVQRFRGAIASEADVRALSQEPLVWVGNHLENHCNATSLSPQRLRQAFWRTQEFLDAHPRGTRLLSYPFGQPKTCYNEATNRLLRQEGAGALFSAYPLPNLTRRGFLYHRVHMSESVRTRDELSRVILTNYLRMRLRLGPTELS